MVAVFIAESNSRDDFYEGRLDGFAANEVLKVRRARTAYRVVLSPDLLMRALNDAAEGGFDVFHLSCHGNDDGIALSDGSDVPWMALADWLKVFSSERKIIVMSSCLGGHVGFSKALTKKKTKFKVLFGSTASRGISFSESCIAWSILYNELLDGGVGIATLRTAVDKMNLVIPGEFVYRRWVDSRGVYLRYPSTQIIG